VIVSQQDFLQLQQIAVEAASKAGRLITQRAEEELVVETKEGGSSASYQVVTEVDRAAQDMIHQILQPTCDEYQIGWLGEESGDDRSRLKQEYFWCVDPLDGTVPFIKKTPGYSVSIALVSQTGKPCIGVVYNPTDQSLLSGLVGEGCYYQQELVQSPEASSPLGKTLTVSVDRSFEGHPLFKDIIQELEKAVQPLGYSKVQPQYYGGAVMNASRALLYPDTCYFKFPRSQDGGGCLWDFAGTAALFTSAGAHVSDIYGNPLELNRKESLFMNHKGVLYTWSPELARIIMTLFKSKYL
jgi:3'(2'), 5'-bisphosphate nucleotidase/myo-inositol-1(or 4)-monophosphatase